jgi:hypothetical protein
MSSTLRSAERYLAVRRAVARAFLGVKKDHFLRKLLCKPFSAVMGKHGMDPTWHVLASNFLSFYRTNDILLDS